jgi:hypothetical protein
MRIILRFGIIVDERGGFGRRFRGSSTGLRSD